MKKLAVLVFIILLGSVFSVQASQIAEVAKKEKARRDAMHHEGKAAKTFTNADVANIKSQLSYVVKSEPATSTASEKDQQLSEATEATNTAARELGQKVEKEQENQQANEERQELTQERDELEQKAKDAQETINQGGGYFTRNIGNQFQQKREAEDRIREIDGQLSKEKESENNEEQPH